MSSPPHEFEKCWSFGGIDNVEQCNFIGSWVPWDNSCKDCVNASQWTSWFDNMYLSSTTNLCETWAVGQYFDATVNTWRSWDGSCLKGCSYQKNWYVCPTGQYYDLESKTCVNSCGANTISVNRQRYQGVPIWKSTNIYVDPTSSSIIELGTKSDPYKNLVLAFLDALNIFSHQNVTLNVYVKENTILPVTIGSMYNNIIFTYKE